MSRSCQHGSRATISLWCCAVSTGHARDGTTLHVCKHCPFNDADAAERGACHALPTCRSHANPPVCAAQRPAQGTPDSSNIMQGVATSAREETAGGCCTAPLMCCPTVGVVRDQPLCAGCALWEVVSGQACCCVEIAEVLRLCLLPSNWEVMDPF